MKEYNVPDLYVIEDVEEMLLDSATLEWEVDPEKNQIVVISRYEEVETDEGEDDMYFDDLDDEMAMSQFKLRPEPLEILRVDCDASVFESVHEWDDENGHHKDVVTKEQQVAFEIRGNVDEVREMMGWNEDFEMHSSDLGSYTVAFRKDGLWWFLDMVTLNLVEFSVYNEEEDEYEEVPFFCESIFELNSTYTLGDAPQEFEFGISGRQTYLICENDGVQYGMEFYDGQGTVIALNESGSEGELLPPWTSIRREGWCDVMLLTREENGEVKEQKLNRGFDLTVATFNPDSIGWEEDAFAAFEYDFVHVGGTTLLRIVQGSRLKMMLLKRDEMISLFGDDEEEENELLQEVRSYRFGQGSVKIKARAGKNHFVVERPVKMGYRQRMQYRIIFEGQYLDGIWDDVEVIQSGDDTENFFRVKKDGYWGVVDELGVIVVPVKYHKIRVNGIFMHKETKVSVDGVDKKILFHLMLDDFGQKGYGVLTEDGFVQIIPCNYDAVMAAFAFSKYDGIQVEKMGRKALYSYYGTLKEEFKPGHLDSTVF